MGVNNTKYNNTNTTWTNICPLFGLLIVTIPNTLPCIETKPWRESKCEEYLVGGGNVKSKFNMDIFVYQPNP